MALRYDEPMVSDDFLAFGHYLKWANIKLIGMLEPVPVEHWTEEMGGSFEHLQGTASHLFWALDVWLDRLDGQQLSDRFPPQDPALDLAPFRHVDQRFSDWIEQLDEEALGQKIDLSSPSGGTFQMAPAEILQHLVNHSSYHRGQIVEQLRRLGHKVVSTDYVFFILANRGK